MSDSVFRQRFKQSVDEIVSRGDSVHFIAHDLKLDQWFIVTEIKLHRIGGTVEEVIGYDPLDYDKDGYTWYGGPNRHYYGKPRYEVFHRLSRTQL